MPCNKQKPVQKDRTSSLVKRVEKGTTSFSSLEPAVKADVLAYIEKHGLGIRFFEKKWFDLTANKFYAEEFVINEKYRIVDLSTKAFDDFPSFFEYVKGDIYEKSCYFGYSFSDEEIRNYGIDIAKLNFDSFETYTIHEHSSEQVDEGKYALLSKTENFHEKAIRLIRQNCPHDGTSVTMDDIESMLEIMESAFPDFYGTAHCLFAYLIAYGRETSKNALINFACRHDVYDGFSFFDVLMVYGFEAAEYVIEHFSACNAPSTQRSRINGFKDALKRYRDYGEPVKKRILYDSLLGLYEITLSLVKGATPISIARGTNYFSTFEELAAFCGGDFAGVDFSNAPLTKEELDRYKTDEKTIYPRGSGPIARYEVRKFYKNNVSNGVIQSWFFEDGHLAEKNIHHFEHFFDFVHFLKGDLSDADILMCEGLERLKNVEGLKLDGIKARSSVKKALGLPLEEIDESKEKKPLEFAKTKENESVSSDFYPIEERNSIDFDKAVSYVTDIHLKHRFLTEKCLTDEDREYVMRKITGIIANQSTAVTVIGGDTSSDFEVFSKFVEALEKEKRHGDIFFTLGNHEITALSGLPLDRIIEKYRGLLNKTMNIRLIQNNVFYRKDSGLFEEITEDELNSFSVERLKELTRDSDVILFGGLGFAGTNEELNADTGLYCRAIDRAQEVKESKKFLKLYKKVTKAFEGRNLVVVSHTPMRDWAGKAKHKPGVIHINGHTHTSYYRDDESARIFADNQVGYKGRNVYLKRIYMEFGYDWFADYKDGIYKITQDDYERFYVGIREHMSFNKEFKNLYMLKKDGTYMFLMEDKNKEILRVLNGGRSKSAYGHTPEYYYEHLSKYSSSVKMFLSDYDSFQKRVASEVKKIGGKGKIHGCIIDIDYFNHLYLNPLDGKITPYFAYSMVNKYVYADVPSLLCSECPAIYKNYQKLLAQEDGGKTLAIYSPNLPAKIDSVHVTSTDMYKISRIVKGFQFVTKYNVVRLWNDNIIADANKENGRLIVTNMIEQIKADK